MQINLSVNVDRQNAFNFGNLPVGGAATTIPDSKRLKDSADIKVCTADAHKHNHESYAETHGKADQLKFIDVDLPGVGAKTIPVAFPSIELAQEGKSPVASLGWPRHGNWERDFSKLSHDAEFVDGLIPAAERERLAPVNPLNLVVWDKDTATLAAYKGLTEECYGVEASVRNNATVVRDYFDQALAHAYEAAQRHGKQPLTVNLDYDGDAITHCVYDSVKQRLSRKQALEEQHPGLIMNVNVVRENVNAIPLPLEFITRENGKGERNVPLTDAERQHFQQEMDAGRMTLADVNKQVSLEELEKLGARVVSLESVLARNTQDKQQSDAARDSVIDKIKDFSQRFAIQNRQEAERDWPTHALNQKPGHQTQGNLQADGGPDKQQMVG